MNETDLRKDLFILDGHFDLTMDMLDRRERGEKNVYLNHYDRDFTAGGINCVFSALFLHDHFLPEMALRKALCQISVLHDEIEESHGRLKLCTSTAQIKEANSEGKLAVLLSFEGVEPLMGDMRLLRIFHSLGVRGIGLVWSRRNEAAEGCTFHPVEAGSEGGLSAFGLKLVRHAEELGMFIDVSHLNDSGFWNVMDVARGPVIASHSNCRSLCDHPRNLTDDQIKAIAAKNGVIGINALSAFVVSSAAGRKASVDDLVSHVDHMAGLVGTDHIGIGFDFDGTFLDYSGMGKAIDVYDVIDGHRETPVFTSCLRKRGYSDADIRKILGLNFLRVLGNTIG